MDLWRLGHEVLDATGAERAPESVGWPRAATQASSPGGGLWGLAPQASQTGAGGMPSCRHHKRLGAREPMPQWRFGAAYGQAPQPDQALGGVVDKELEQGASLACVR
jgi:hypothetical protein